MDEILGKHLIELRKSRGLDAKSVSEQVGITENQLKSIEFAIKEPTQEELTKLAQFYGVDTASLYIKGAQLNAQPQPVEQTPIAAQVSPVEVVPNPITEVDMSKKDKNNVQPQQPIQPQVVPQQPVQPQTMPQQPVGQQPYPPQYPQQPYPPQYAGPVQYQEAPRKFPLALLITIAIFSIGTIVALFLPFIAIGDNSIPLYQYLLPEGAASLQALLTIYFFNVEILGVIVYWLLIALVVGAVLDIVMMVLLCFPIFRRSFVAILEKIFVIIFGILSLLGFLVIIFFLVFSIIQSEGNLQSILIFGSYSFIVLAVTQMLTFILKMCAAPRIFKVKKEPKAPKQK